MAKRALKIKPVVLPLRDVESFRNNLEHDDFVVRTVFPPSELRPRAGERLNAVSPPKRSSGL